MNIQRTSIILLTMLVCGIATAQTEGKEKETSPMQEKLKTVQKKELQAKEVVREVKEVKATATKDATKVKDDLTKGKGGNKAVDAAKDAMPATVVATPKREWAKDKAGQMKQHQDHMQLTAERQAGMETKIMDAEKRLDEKFKKRQIKEADYKLKKERLAQAKAKLNAVKTRNTDLQGKLKQEEQRITAPKAK